MLMARGLSLEDAIAVDICHRQFPVVITDLGGNQYPIYHWGTRLNEIGDLLREQHEEFRDEIQPFEIVELRLNGNEIAGALFFPLQDDDEDDEDEEDDEDD